MKQHNTAMRINEHFDVPDWKQCQRALGECMSKSNDTLHKYAAKADFVKSLHNTRQYGVLSGSRTFHDLLATDLLIGGKYRTPEEIKNIFNGLTLEQREKAFPRQEICAHLGITEEQYREIDKFGNRRDAFVLLKKLFADAKHVWNKNKIPHMLLIEELVTTFNAGCIGGFLYDTVTTAVTHQTGVTQVPWIQRGTHPKEKKLHISCTNPNRIAVRAEYSLYPWPESGNKAQVLVEYDIAIVEGKLISYQDVATTVRYLSNGNTWSWMPRWAIDKSPIVNPTISYPEKYKGVVMLGAGGAVLGLKGKTFTAQSMLSQTLYEDKLPDSYYKESVMDSVWGFLEQLARSLAKLLEKAYYFIWYLIFGCGTQAYKMEPDEDTFEFISASSEGLSTQGAKGLTPEHTAILPEQHDQLHNHDEEHVTQKTVVSQPCAQVTSVNVSSIDCGVDTSQSR